MELYLNFFKLYRTKTSCRSGKYFGIEISGMQKICLEIMDNKPDVLEVTCYSHTYREGDITTEVKANYKHFLPDGYEISLLNLSGRYDIYVYCKDKSQKYHTKKLSTLCITVPNKSDGLRIKSVYCGKDNKHIDEDEVFPSFSKLVIKRSNSIA